MDRTEHFYHGTTSNITDGMVRPAMHVDKNVSEYSMGDPGDMSEGDHAFVTKDEGYAWHAAGTFHKNGRRPRVYETEGAPDMKPGPWNKDHPDFLSHHELDDPKHYDEPDHDSDDRGVWEGMVQDAEHARTQSQPEYGSPTGFPVRKRIDIMPGRQGTLVGENWNKFKKDGPRYGPDANHPNDSQVKFGTNVMNQPTHQPLRGGMSETSVHEQALNEDQFRSGHDWRKDPAPHSEMREMAGRPQKRWATLLD